MRAFLVVLALAVGLASFNVRAATADADLLAGPGDGLLFASEGNAIATTRPQRSLLGGYSSPLYAPTYCINAQIKPQFTAKVAVLVIGQSKKHPVGTGAYVKLVAQRIKKRLKRYNKRYRLSLTFVISQNSRGYVRYGQQKWFYYDIKFVVGTCGRYKFPLVTQLRGDIQPSADFIKRVRLLSYPFK